MTENRTIYNTLAILLWSALAVVAYRYWLVWNELPAHMASHFDAAGQVNGWMTRESSLYFALGFLAFLCAVFSVVLGVVRWKYGVSKLSWALLAFFHGEIWAVVYLLNSMVEYNLHGSPISAIPVMIITPLGVLALLVVAFGEKRGSAFPETDVVAEEVHAARRWGLLFLVPMLIGIVAVPILPRGAAQLAAALFCFIFLAVVGMAWDGFHYVFTRHGVEIRTLGFRLKSIPLGEIKQYAVGSWSPMCGYGIRGIGKRKAYVWGNRGVRIQTYDGEVFLGHSDPERVVRDLDLIQQYSHS